MIRRLLALIIHWPAGLKTKPGSLDATPGYLTDIMPTALAVSGASYPATSHGTATTPLEGQSLLPILTASGKINAPRILTWEQYGFKAVRAGDLKAVFSPPNLYDKRGLGRWELYDLARDRTELHDLASTRPDDLATLVAHWDAWAARAQVFPVPTAPGPKQKKANAPAQKN